MKTEEILGNMEERGESPVDAQTSSLTLQDLLLPPDSPERAATLLPRPRVHLLQHCIHSLPFPLAGPLASRRHE